MLRSAGYVTEVVKLGEGYVVKMLIPSLNHFESLKGWGKYAVNHSFITAWKESKCGVFPGPYFPVFSPNKRKNSVFGHFSRSALANELLSTKNISFASKIIWVWDHLGPLNHRIFSQIISEKQKQFSRGLLRKRCSENMQHIFKETPMLTVISIKFQ